MIRCVRCGAGCAQPVTVTIEVRPEAGCVYSREIPWCEECESWAVASVQQWARYFARGVGDPVGPQPDPSLEQLPEAPE